MPQNNATKTWLLCRGGIESWTISRTGHLFFGVGQHSSVGSVSAQCSDGKLLPSVTYGFNGTGGNCTVLLNQTQTVSNPYSNQFFYRYIECFTRFILLEEWQWIEAIVDRCMRLYKPISNIIRAVFYSKCWCLWGVLDSEAQIACHLKLQLWPFILSTQGASYYNCLESGLLHSKIWHWSVLKDPLNLNLICKCSAGAFLDGFISFGAPNPPATPYFACNTSQVAVGFRAASNCLALTTFQVSSHILQRDSLKLFPQFHNFTELKL